MRSHPYRQLPYLGHNNRELGLMLSGRKPLTYFLRTNRESRVIVRYLRMFDRHAAAGRLIRREVSIAFSDPPHWQLLYALPGHEWRIDAMLTLLNAREVWSDDHERRSAELLGYEDWQIDCWLTYLLKNP
jgi:hypothetical protein